MTIHQIKIRDFQNSDFDFTAKSLTSYSPNHSLWNQLDDSQIEALRVAVLLLKILPSSSPLSELDANARKELCTEPASFRGHIAGSKAINHCNPPIALAYGVPQQDLQVMQLLNQVFPGQYRMEWAVKKVIERLEEKFPGNEKAAYDQLPAEDRFNYKVVLTKLLLATEAMDLSRIDWKRVFEAFPYAVRVEMDWENDTPFPDFNSEHGTAVLTAIGVPEGEAVSMVGGYDRRGSIQLSGRYGSESIIIKGIIDSFYQFSSTKNIETIPLYRNLIGMIFNKNYT